METKSFIAAIAILFGLAVPASALTVTSVEGAWQNASPGVFGEGTSQIRWGTQWRGYDLSGYDFSATPTNFEAYQEESFVLGTFNHLNFPVTGTFLQSVDLAISFTIGGLSDAITSVFSFEHIETLNNQRRFCENGGRNRTGININGCADKVSATLNLGQSESFVINDVTYVMDVLGFHQGIELMTDFWTAENAVNSAELVAVFRILEGQEPPVSEVPLPASGLLLLGGLVGLFAKRRFS